LKIDGPLFLYPWGLSCISILAIGGLEAVAMPKTVRLGFVTTKPNKSDPKFTPFTYICVETYSRDKEGNVYISPQLMSDAEIDEHINLLINDLEIIRTKAKKSIKKKF